MGPSQAALDDQRKAIAAVIEFMRRDLAAPVTLRDLADFAAYSPFHLNRIFSTSIGVPPAEFRAALRFDWAKHLLLTSDLSVTEICNEVGFDSLGTFSTRFTELVGVNPKHFRHLPELWTSMPDDIVHRGDADSTAVVSGHVDAPGCGPVYIGLFPSRIARGRPVAGTFLPEPGDFAVAPVPVGEFHLLAAAFPPGTDALGQLLPNDSMRVGSSPETVVVRTGTEQLRRTLTLAPRQRNSPPVIVALPALLE
jgi:AraC-like DNA-binding protein